MKTSSKIVAIYVGLFAFLLGVVYFWWSFVTVAGS